MAAGGGDSHSSRDSRKWFSTIEFDDSPAVARAPSLTIYKTQHVDKIVLCTISAGRKGADGEQQTSL